MLNFPRYFSPTSIKFQMCGYSRGEKGGSQRRALAGLFVVFCRIFASQFAVNGALG